VAAQLSTKRIVNLLSTGSADMHLPARALTGACVVVVLLCIASLLVGAWTAQRDTDAALQRYTDTQALLALPQTDITVLETERDAAKAALAAAEAQLAPPSVDPSSDDATSLLVRRATEAGLAVKGIASAPMGEATNGPIKYDVVGIRVIVEGNVGRVLDLLIGLGKEEPGLIPALTSMTTSDTDVTRAEISFNVYTKQVEPTPVAPPAGSTAR
jgi:hypothetical protein